MGVSVTGDICGSCDRMCRASADNQITLTHLVSPPTFQTSGLYLDLDPCKLYKMYLGLVLTLCLYVGSLLSAETCDKENAEPMSLGKRNMKCEVPFS